ncbi:hypothetical protein SMC26_18835 [Actinomadura fulvescens]|uniref:Uncharacterized protein n=1 Tax=Actinomadura fulvescens TaxID=46160 RepID=A0ABN3QFQ0_9ACTN
MHVQLIVDEPDEDFQYLVDEVSELDIENLENVSAGQAPEGARAGELAEAGMLAVTLAGSPVLGALVDVARDWLRRRRSGTIRMKIGNDVLELDAVPRDMQQQALEAFLSRHTE